MGSLPVTAFYRLTEQLLLSCSRPLNKSGHALNFVESGFGHRVSVSLTQSAVCVSTEETRSVRPVRMIDQRVRHNNTSDRLLIEIFGG